jgi:hypothetical protein
MYYREQEVDRLNTPLTIVIARSETTKQSLYFQEE